MLVFYTDARPLRAVGIAINHGQIKTNKIRVSTAIPENLVFPNFFFSDVDSCHVKNIPDMSEILRGGIRPRSVLPRANSSLLVWTQLRGSNGRLMGSLLLCPPVPLWQSAKSLCTSRCFITPRYIVLSKPSLAGYSTGPTLQER